MRKFEVGDRRQSGKGKERWFRRNNIVIPCVGSKNWSTIYASSVSDTIEYVHDKVRRNPLETIKDEEPKPTLKLYYVNSIGDTNHRKRRQNLNDMIFLFTLFTANLKIKGKGVSNEFGRTLDFKVVRKVFALRTRAIFLDSTGQKRRGCGLYCAYNYNILFILSENQNETGNEKD